MKLLTVAQVAALKGIHVNTVRKAIHDGRLEALHIGRDYLMTEKQVATYKEGKPGRPRKRRIELVAKEPKVKP